jgi:hypothetical protein
MNKTLRTYLALLTTALIASCGGGGPDAGTSPFVTDPSNGDPTAANLTLLLSSSSIQNSGAATVTATATATTSSGQALTGIPITFSVDNGATFTQSSATTTASGQVVATVSIGADPSNRVITVRATSGSLSASAPFAVTGASLSATGSAVVAPGSTANQVSFRLTNANGIGLAAQPITVVAGTLGSVTGTTGTNGDYVYTYTAPATTGALDIVGTAGGVSQTLSVLVQAGAGSILPAVGPINSASVSANPSVVSTNTASTSNRTEIRALFVGPGNAPIPRVRVRFDLSGDPNAIGGTFSTGSSVIYSDAAGTASTAYIPADRASPTNGVTIRACYALVDFPANTCPNATTATITVVADPLSVSIGSNNLIIPGPGNLTYRRQFVVLVVDASGRAKANVDIVPSIDLPVYLKGRYVRAGTTWIQGTADTSVTPNVVTARNPVACLNEDLQRNGVLESSEDALPQGNHSGSIEPRKSDATITIIGTGKTDANGSVVIQVEYPQNVGSWLQVKILVSATGVSGTEGRATWTEILPVPVDATTAPAAPPFLVSPYGIAIDPADVVVFPDGTPGASNVLPCNNPY